MSAAFSSTTAAGRTSRIEAPSGLRVLRGDADCGHFVGCRLSAPGGACGSDQSLRTRSPRGAGHRGASFRGAFSPDQSVRTGWPPSGATARHRRWGRPASAVPASASSLPTAVAVPPTGCQEPINPQEPGCPEARSTEVPSGPINPSEPRAPAGPTPTAPTAPTEDPPGRTTLGCGLGYFMEKRAQPSLERCGGSRIECTHTANTRTLASRKIPKLWSVKY